MIMSAPILTQFSCLIILNHSDKALSGYAICSKLFYDKTKSYLPDLILSKFTASQINWYPVLSFPYFKFPPSSSSPSQTVDKLKLIQSSDFIIL